VFRFLAINVNLVSLHHDRALERLNFFVSQRCFRFQSVEDFRCAVVMNSGVLFDAPSIYGFALGFFAGFRVETPAKRSFSDIGQHLVFCGATP
jgi:hypothetical protein